jgi:hypothetical protein
MAIQWHPLFVQLLRPLVEGYYETQTNVSVGDVPRAADLVLLRRTTNATLPFRSLWQHLTNLNILEYKGPTVAARLEHLTRLMLNQPPLWELFAQVLANLHPDTLKELTAMARTSKKEPKLHIKEYAEFLGMKNVIDELGLRRIIDVVVLL